MMQHGESMCHLYCHISPSLFSPLFYLFMCRIRSCNLRLVDIVVILGGLLLKVQD